MELLIAFIAGLVIMDLLWAWRLGLIDLVIAKIKSYFIKEKA